jgi:hypothetical protein
MKSYRFIALVAASCCLAISASASVNVEQLTEMAEAKHPEYRALRDAIVAQGEAVLPELDRIYADQSLDWEPRFAAGVCAEHIRRNPEIENLLEYDWTTLPGTESLWKAPLPLTGIPHGLMPYFRQKLVEEGLWFFYLEFFAEKETIDTFKPYHLLYETIGEFVAESSQGDIRQWAVWIAEKDVLANTDGKNCHSQYLAVFEQFVKDGTYPQGIQYFLSHLRLNGHIRYWAIESISDPSALESLLTMYANDEIVSVVINERLRTIRSDLALANMQMETLGVPGTPPAPKPPTPSPVAVSPSFQEKVPSERNISIFVLFVSAIVAGIVFFANKRRHRP